MTIPSDYLEGYEKARKLDRELADRYMAHTQIGDPTAEAMTEDLSANSLVVSFSEPGRPDGCQ